MGQSIVHILVQYHVSYFMKYQHCTKLEGCGHVRSMTRTPPAVMRYVQNVSKMKSEWLVLSCWILATITVLDAEDRPVLGTSFR